MDEVDVNGRPYVLKNGIYVPKTGDGPTYSRSELEAAGYISGGSDDAPNRQKFTFDDGSLGSFDPATGSYFDASGRPVTQAPRQSGGLKNLGNGVFADETGIFIEETVQTGSGADDDPYGTTKQRRYLTEAQAEAILDPEGTARGGGGGGSSGVGWAQLAESRRQFDLNMAQRMTEWEAQLEQAEKDYALSLRAQGFLESKAEFEQSQDEKRLANETRAQLFGEYAHGQNLALNIANLQNNIAQANAQMQSNTDQFNRTMQFNVDQANRQAQEQKAARLQSLASDISSASKDAGDRGALASFVLANSGWGAQDAGMAGEDATFVTDESLTGLEGLLRNREDVMAQPDNPFSFNPIKAPKVAAPDLAFLNKDFAPQQMAASDPLVNEAKVATDWKLQGRGGLQDTDGRTGEFVGNTWIGPDPLKNLPKKADGGMVQGAYIGDEEGPEIHIPVAAGISIVIPNDKVKQMAPEKRKKMTKMADGGVFAGGIFEGLGTDRTRARNFQTEAVSRARAGTPFANQLPTPVYGSSPGLNPIVIDLLNALNAQAKGIPVAFSERQQALLRPAGMSERVIGRTA